jgi:hypothetical protein
MVALSLRIAAFAALMFALPAFAQSEARPSEVQIKAAFLYKFGEFVQWPPAAFGRAGAPFTIGVLGAEELASVLEQLVVDRTVQGRPIVVRRLRRGESLAGLHVLFIGQAETPRLAETLAAARSYSVLTVTEAENALASGAMINFVADDSRVRFDVALPSAERGQLKISSRLLAVARRVITS